MMTHSSKKPFECKFANCSKSYCDARSLKRHLENYHQASIKSFQDSDAGQYSLGTDVSLEKGVLQGNLHSDVPDTSKDIWAPGFNPLEFVDFCRVYFFFTIKKFFLLFRSLIF